jgi:DNA mismatch endonuclease (patch repair protein)
MGYRFRLHNRSLPGRPDIVLAKYRLAIFVHGCFWHRHGCSYTYTPKSRLKFWIEKFKENFNRDYRNQKALRELDWRVFVVWECEIKDKKALEKKLKNVIEAVGLE